MYYIYVPSIAAGLVINLSYELYDLNSPKV